MTEEGPLSSLIAWLIVIPRLRESLDSFIPRLRRLAQVFHLLFLSSVASFTINCANLGDRGGSGSSNANMALGHAHGLHKVDDLIRASLPVPPHTLSIQAWVAIIPQLLSMSLASLQCLLFRAIEHFSVDYFHSSFPVPPS